MDEQQEIARRYEAGFEDSTETPTLYIDMCRIIPFNMREWSHTPLLNTYISRAEYMSLRNIGRYSCSLMPRVACTLYVDSLIIVLHKSACYFHADGFMCIGHMMYDNHGLQELHYMHWAWQSDLKHSKHSSSMGCSNRSGKSSCLCVLRCEVWLDALAFIDPSLLLTWLPTAARQIWEKRQFDDLWQLCRKK